MKEINWVLLLFAGFTAVGILEWIKGFFSKLKKPIPGNVWRGLMPILSVGFWVLAVYVPVIFWGLTVCAVTQLGYQNFVAIGPQLVDILKSKIGGGKNEPSSLDNSNSDGK